MTAMKGESGRGDDGDGAAGCSWYRVVGSVHDSPSKCCTTYQVVSFHMLCIDDDDDGPNPRSVDFSVPQFCLLHPAKGKGSVRTKCNTAITVCQLWQSDKIKMCVWRSNLAVELNQVNTVQLLWLGQNSHDSGPTFSNKIRYFTFMKPKYIYDP